MIIERIYVSSIEQSNAVNCTKDKEATRNDMAFVYANCIIADLIGWRDGTERVDFRIVNDAILKRWPDGLLYIKTKAWKFVDNIK